MSNRPDRFSSPESAQHLGGVTPLCYCAVSVKTAGLAAPVTVALMIKLPYWSATRTIRFAGSSVPAATVWLLPDTTWRRLGTGDHVLRKFDALQAGRTGSDVEGAHRGG